MMGAEIAALMGFFGLTGAFALVGTVLAAWMAWRIVEKAGLPGWTGLGAILLTLTGVGSVVPLILLWVFAFMRWPRDEPAAAAVPGFASPTTGGPAPSSPPRALAAPPMKLADRRGWQLAGGAVSLTVDGSLPAYVVTGAAAAQAGDLSVPDPSVGQPHARLLVAGSRLGLEDLGSPGGTFIDGARLLPEHGPRDISAARAIRIGSVELALSRI
ncbi:MAG: FHA domain-containing protein [Rhodospirillales bacterium]|nr:FHA domain-containing protein [Rhodospirillales bacterium]